MKNYSRQREEIIKVIKDSYNHPTAEEIYMTVKAKDPAVSRSTVYRNLGLLVENGFINKILCATRIYQKTGRIGVSPTLPVFLRIFIEFLRFIV